MMPLRDWLRHPAGMLTKSHRALEAALAHGALVSERLHVTILAGLFGLIGMTGLILYRLFPDLPLQVFRGRLPGVTVSLIVGAAFGYELLARTVFGSQLLISEVVWQAINSNVKNATPLGRVPVKGHEALVQVYKLA